MEITAYDWNTVVIGQWNRAILTPAGIAKRLFQLPDGTPVAVEVPLDGRAPIRVKDEANQLVVTADEDRLVVMLERPGYQRLGQALTIARRAIVSLPETPFAVAGYNIRFKITDGADLVVSLLSSGIDSRMTDRNHEILERAISRKTHFQCGMLKATVNADQENIVRVMFNFERISKDRDQLIELLNLGVGEVRQTVEQFLVEVFEVDCSDLHLD